MNQDYWSTETNNEANIIIRSSSGSNEGKKSYQSFMKVYNRLWKEGRYVDRHE